MPCKNREARIAYTKKYRQEHQAKIANQRKLYRQNHVLEIKNRMKIYQDKNKDKLAKYRLIRRDITHQYTINRNLKLKTIAITHYGNGKCECVICGYNDIRALSIDHINNDGATHRKSNGIEGNHIYGWLIKNNFPNGFQTLCMNCQLIKRAEEHKTKGASF